MEEITQEFWNRKCEYHIQMYEYGRYSEEEFITNMERMGWDRKTTINLMEQDDGSE